MPKTATPTLTAEEIRDDLRARIADGDTTITAEELHQAETNVEFTRLQTEGAAKRATEAEHQARLDELEQIRDTVLQEFPSRLEEARSLLDTIRQAAVKLRALGTERKTRTRGFIRRVKDIEKQGIRIDDLQVANAGTELHAAGQVIAVQDFERLINMAASPYDQGENITAALESMSRVHRSNLRTYRWTHHQINGSNLNHTTNKLEPRYLHRAGDLQQFTPTTAKPLLDAGWIELAE